MADKPHQNPTTPAPNTPATPEPAKAAPPADTSVVLPRSEEPAPAEKAEKAALEAKERMAKTQGFWNRLSPEKEEKKPEKPAEAQPDKPKGDEKAPVPAPEKKPKSRRREPEVDPIQIAQATGEAIGREMAKATRPATAQPAAAPEPESELPEEFRPDVAVFEEMARLDPKKYGTIKRDLSRYAEAETDYIAKWQEDNPDGTYDGDAPEHDAFYARIRPDYDQKDFKAAEKSLLKKEVRSEVTKEVSEEIRSREAEAERRRERAAQIEPEVAREAYSMLSDMITEIDPENKELTKDWESMKTIDEKNPMLSDAMFVAHNEARPVILATMRLFRAVEGFDKNNPEHQRVAATINEAEQRMSRLPIKDRYSDDGKLFALQDDFAKMTPAEREKHWYIGEAEAVAYLRGKAIARAKSIYEQEKQKVERYTKRGNAAQNGNQPPSKTAETPQQTRSDRGSPSVSGRGTLPGDGQPAPNKPTTGKDLFFSRMQGA